jgi:hypothetical protein
MNRSQSVQEQFVKEVKIVRDLLTSSSGYDDPVKRNSAPYKAPKLSSNVSSGHCIIARIRNRKWDVLIFVTMMCLKGSR